MQQSPVEPRPNDKKIFVRKTSKVELTMRFPDPALNFPNCELYITCDKKGNVYWSDNRTRILTYKQVKSIREKNEVDLYVISLFDLARNYLRTKYKKTWTLAADRDYHLEFCKQGTAIALTRDEPYTKLFIYHEGTYVFQGRVESVEDVKRSIYLTLTK